MNATSIPFIISMCYYFIELKFLDLVKKCTMQHLIIKILEQGKLSNQNTQIIASKMILRSPI